MMPATLLTPLPRQRLATLALLCVAAWSLGGPATAPGAEPDLRFRRYYAPADRIQDWPFGNMRYYSVPPEDFEQLLETVQQAPAGAGGSLASHIARATYEARLTDENLVGEARWQIGLTEVAQPPTLLPLAPCGLAIQESRWDDGRGPALWGTRADGVSLLEVQQPGELVAQWSLRGTRDTSGVLLFEIDLPASPASTFVIDMPAELAPQTNVGLLTEEDAADTSRRRWRIELGGAHRLTLRITSQQLAQQRLGLALVRQNTTYEVAEQGLEIAVQFRLDVHQEPLSRLQLVADPSLRLVAARADDTLSWTVTPAADGATARWTLNFDEPLLGTGRTVRLRAIAPFPLGQKTVLPVVRPADVFWQEGNLALLVPSPLIIRQLQPISCRQSKVGPLLGAAGESIELQCFAADATVELVVARRREPVEVSCGSSVTLDSGEMLAHFAARLSLGWGERFALRAELSEHWLIDSVESDPPGALADWSIEAGEGDTRRLSLRLARALAPDNPLKLHITAHARSLPADGVYSWEVLRVAHFPGVNYRQRLLALRAQGANQLRVSQSDDCLRIDPMRLPEAERDLLRVAPGDLALEITSDVPRWAARLEKQSPVYSATVAVDTLVGGGMLLENYVFDCQPESSRVEQVLIHFTQSRPDPPQWTLGADVRGQLVVEPLSVEAQMAAGLGLGGETWQVTLRRPRTSAFQIRAVRATSLAGDQSIALASLPEATAQQGTLVVRAAADVALDLDTGRLRPMAHDDRQLNRDGLVRGAFRFDPLHDAGPRLITTYAEGQQPLDQAGAVIWQCRVDSQYEPTGGSLHLATLCLENFRRTQLAWKLPTDNTVLLVACDGVEVARPADGQDWEIPLPAGRRFPIVTAQFRTRDEPLGVSRPWQAPRWEFDLPVVARQWTVWLPPGFDLVAPSDGWQSLNRPRPTWGDRLFGALARPIDTRPFNPLELDAWRRLSGDRQAEWNIRRSRAERFYEQLGAARERLSASATRPVTWAELITEYEARLDDLSPLVRIDSAALADQLLGPQTELPAVGVYRTGPLAAGIETVVGADLAVVCDEQGLVLTTATVAAAHRRQLLPLGPLATFAAMPGPLMDDWQQQRSRGESRLDLPVVWAVAATPPWPALPPAGSRASDYLGWSAYQVYALESPPVAWVMRGSSIRAAGVSAGLIVFTLLWWRLRNRAWGLFSSAVILGVVALLVPDGLAPVASGAVLGALAALIASLLLPRASNRRAAAGPRLAPSSSTVGRAAGTATALWLVFAAGVNPACAQPLANPRPANREVHKVFIPSDDVGQPTGERYLVPELLYRELKRRARLALGEPDGWLVESAAYRLTLARDAMLGRTTVANFTVRFDLHVFQPGTLVEIPLRRDAATLAPDAALLDGRAAFVEWNESGTAVLCEIADRGPTQLELTLRPSLITTSEYSWFDLAIPPVTRAHLEVQLPTELATVELPTVAGKISTSDDRQRISAELGPANRLLVRWSERPGGRLGPAVDVDEMSWLRVRPGSVVLEAQIRFKVSDGQLRDIRLAADPRLRLLPTESREGLIAGARSVVGDAATPANRQLLQVDLQRAVSDEGAVRLSFLVTDTSGIGQLRMPPLEVLGARSVRRWWALTVDPLLDYSASGEHELTSIAVPEFMNLWGRSEAQPQSAWQSPRVDAPWSLATRPRRTQATADQTLDLTVDQRRVLVDFSAQLQSQDGYRFQQRLAGPPGLEVDSVSIIEEGAQRVARWSSADDGTITVFLTAPVTGPQRLSLRGRLPLDEATDHPLPALRLLDTEISSNLVRVYRRPAVLASVADFDGYVEAADTAANPPAGDLGRLLVILRSTRDNAQARLHVQPNQPRLEITQVASLSRASGGWEAELDCHVQVQEGLLDALRLEVPPSWSGPFELTPPTPYEVVEIPGDARRHLVLQPRTAIAGDYRVLVRGPLTVAPGQSPALPDVRAIDVAAPRRYVRLPTQVGLDQVGWETLRMEPAALPPPYDTGKLGDEAFRVYRVTGDHPRAVLSAVAPGASRPRAYLADVHLTWSGQGYCRGLATFDVQPSGLDACRLRMPPGTELVEVRVAGLAVAVTPLDDHLWRVPLYGHLLPTRIELLYTGQLDTQRMHWDRVQLAAPQLEDLPAASTLWTICGPTSAGRGEALEGGVATAARQEVARMQALANLLQLDPDAMVIETSEEILAWYRPWAERWLAARSALHQQLAAAPNSAAMQAIAAEAATLEAQQRLAARQLGVEALLDQMPDQQPQIEQPAPLWRLAFVGGRPVTLAVVDGPSPTITIRYPTAENADWLWRSAASLLVLCGLFFVRRWLNAADWPRRWPQLLGVVVGIVWWLWLTPSAVGWVIIVVSLLAGMHPSLRATPEPSRVIRVSASYR